MPAQMRRKFSAERVALAIRRHADHLDAPGLFQQVHGVTDSARGSGAAVPCDNDGFKRRARLPFWGNDQDR